MIILPIGYGYGSGYGNGSGCGNGSGYGNTQTTTRKGRR